MLSIILAIAALGAAWRWLPPIVAAVREAARPLSVVVIAVTVAYPGVVTAAVHLAVGLLLVAVLASAVVLVVAILRISQVGVR